MPGVEVTALPRWTGGVNLYRRGVYTTQKSWLWCTAASIQIIRNITRGTNDHTAKNQRRYFNWMRKHNRYRLPLSAGVDAQGWAAGFRHYVDARYRLVASKTFASALRLAVIRLRKTNLPVGVTVSRGNHAWVLHRFHRHGRSGDDRELQGDERPRHGPPLRATEPERLRHEAQQEADRRPVQALLHAVALRPEADDLGWPLHLDPAGDAEEGGCRSRHVVARRRGGVRRPRRSCWRRRRSDRRSLPPSPRD